MGVHEYPVRYSLSPEEKRAVAVSLKAQGGASDKDIKGMCQHYGVAKKVIGQILSELKLPIIPDPVRKPKARQTKRKDPRTAAEALFKAPTPPNTELAAPPPKERDADLLALIELEAQMKAEQDNLLQSLHQMEAEMTAAVAEAQRERERAENAIQQTKRLRKATREERAEVEDLRGRVSSAERKFKRQKSRADFMSAELKASVKREKLLIAALEKSEADLAKCRAR